MVVEVDENKKIKRTYLVNDDSVNNLNAHSIELVSDLEIRHPSSSIPRVLDKKSENIITYRIETQEKIVEIPGIENSNKCEPEMAVGAEECLNNEITTSELRDPRRINCDDNGEIIL